MSQSTYPVANDFPEGTFLASYIPQIPMPGFHRTYPTFIEAQAALDLLASFSLFEYEHKVKPDYADVAVVSLSERDPETGDLEWFDYEEEDHESVEPTKTYFTFGSQYSYEPHPTIPNVHPDGLLEVVGVDHEQARKMVWGLTDGKFAFDYPADRVSREYYPRGVTQRIVVTGIDPIPSKTDEITENEVQA